MNEVVISLDELQNGLNDIYDLVYSKVKSNISKLKKLQVLAHKYKIYTKVSDDTQDSTKFIYTISGKKLKTD